MELKKTQLTKEHRKRRFEALFGSNYSRVFSFVLRRTQDRDLAEEIVAETFLIAWRRFEDLPSEALPWLFGTARRVLANHVRYTERRSRHGSAVPLEYVELGDPSASTSDLIADRQAFVTAFAAIRAEDREVLALIAWDGLSSREAAETLGCSTAAFSLRLHRARRRLLKEMTTFGHSLGEEGEKSHPCTKPGAAEAP
ncbi:MAG TPA: RNA polymerase sigma factor [Solirubrobacterales bacterium]|nr:RNA polymerase sigma factor [Solirubrobacterales bacterium]